MPNLIAWIWKNRINTINRVRHWLCLLLLFSTPAFADKPLANHPSPYVRLHANDATHWQLLDQQLLQRAKKQNKLLFVSIGYFACHWCHVMREESFDNAAVAEQLNKHFIPVKVDRELNPALDEYLMTFLQRTRGFGGWPLNVFLTPDGYPLLGLVYAPQAEFLQLLERMHENWQRRPQELSRLAHDAFDAERRSLAVTQPMPSTQQLIDQLMAEVHDAADDFAGGFGDQSKFPRPALLLTLLDVYANTRDAWLEEFLQLTLDQMAGWGLRDAVGGGFFRYVVDPQWHTPHYEKMLYTNAGLTLVYVRAYQVFGRDEYLQLAQDTAQFMVRDMGSSRGLISALSAQDAQGVEGGPYLWRQAQLQGLMDAGQWREFNLHWQLLRQDHGLLPVGAMLGEQWQALRQKLRRQHPAQNIPRDDKVLLSWNGYALSALAAVARSGDARIVQQQGDRLFDLLLQALRDQPARRTEVGAQHFLEDYALVITGILDWAEFGGRDEALRPLLQSRLLAALQLFYDGRLWQLSDGAVIPMPGGQFNIADGALPAADAQLLALIHRLDMQARPELQTLLRTSAAQVDQRLLQDPLSFASHIRLRLQRAPLKSVVLP